jgi:hypothetical protein
MRPPHSRGDDAGLIAIVVALSVSTFLLGFAALAVDLGAAYARRAELQSVANQLTLAGAKGLPTIPDALTQIDQALTAVCADRAVPGLCGGDPENPVAPEITWADDGVLGNGEVDFFIDPDGDGKYNPDDRITEPDSKTEATALRVRLAPSTVEFGLAGALGVQSATLTKSATGRIGTPLGAGLLPFALTPEDLTRGQFCVRDPAPDPEDLRIPAPTGFPRVRLRQPGTQPNPVPDSSPVPVTRDLQLLRSVRGPLAAVQFHFLNSAPDAEPVISANAVLRAGSRPRTWSVELPAGGPGSTVTVWATGTQNGRDFVTDTTVLTYPGSLPAGSQLCDQLSAQRGYVRLARQAGDSGGLAQNIRSGPQVKLYPATGPLGLIGDLLDCGAISFARASSCVSIAKAPFSASLTAGLLWSSGSTPGRMLGDCGNGTTTSHGRTGVDDSRLFTDPGFVDVNGHASASELRTRITEPAPVGPQDRGWLTSKVLRCPRLAVLPVIDSSGPIGPISGPVGARSIDSFRYVWIDDETDVGHRGLNGNGSRVTSMRGYVVDPGYFPALISGSRTVGPFLGRDMPREAMLITNMTK